MPSASSLRTMTPLLDEEIDELDQFLLSGSASDETMSMSELDGYLTAIVVGPKTVAPSLWLPGVWGPTQDDTPEFETAEQAQRILTLIMRHVNGIVWSLQHGPDDFDPLFNSFRQPGKHREYVDGEAWAYGFMQGIALTREDWQALFDDEVMVHVLQPIHLLGSDDVADDEDALTQTPAQREKITETIAAAVAAVYRFWLPRREEFDTVLAGAPNVRKAHKTGVTSLVRAAVARSSRNAAGPLGHCIEREQAGTQFCEVPAPRIDSVTTHLSLQAGPRP